MKKTFHLPGTHADRERDLWEWYGNVELELRTLPLSAVEKRHYAEYYLEAGLLRSLRRPFFRQHYSRSFAQAADFLLAAPGARILDLGCGTGTQALYLALSGARPFGLDLDECALSILHKRKSFYEDLGGRELALDCAAADAFAFDYARIAPLDGIWSMFALNMMQPSSKLLECILPHCRPDARFALLDGNNRSWMGRFVPSRRREVWSPQRFERELSARGFEVVEHRGGIVLPPIVWALGPRALLGAVDRGLGHSWFWPISHALLAQRALGAAGS